MKQIDLKVNGRRHTVNVDPDSPLLFVLSDQLGLRGPRFGCGMTQCGSCTVIMMGQVVRSCVVPVKAVAEVEITNLEGLGHPAGLYRRRRGAMWILFKRRDPDCKSCA